MSFICANMSLYLILCLCLYCVFIFLHETEKAKQLENESAITKANESIDDLNSRNILLSSGVEQMKEDLYEARQRSDYYKTKFIK